MIDAKTLERMRDLQAELGAMLDRFHATGLAALYILQMLSAESEIWTSRDQEEEDEEP